MRAVRWHGRRDVRVEEVPEPVPGPGQVVVRVASCGICGTDVHEYRSGPIQVPLSPHPVTGRSAPVTLGHEISGWVTATGPGVEGLRRGALVALNALIPCGACAECASGSVHLCRNFGHLGMSADGGLADLVLAPADMVVPAPPGMSPEVVALAEPFAVAVHAIALAGRPEGAACAVVGAGTIGLASAVLLRAAGNDVTLVDVAQPRLAHAEAMGFRAVHSDDPDLDALEVPLALECSGAVSAPDRAVRLVARGGLVVLTGLPGEASPIDIDRVVLREVRLTGSMSHQAEADMAPALAFLAEHAEEAARIVTARVPLEAAVPEGLDALVGPEAARHAKILVQVSTSPPGGGFSG